MDEEVVDKCAICLVALSADAAGGFGITPCGHRFHLECWAELVTIMRPLLCPICREDVNPHLDPVEISIRADEHVASDSSSFTNNNTEQLPDLTGLVISDSEPGSLNQLTRNLDLQSIDCGWIAVGRRNQCFTLSISASMLHGMSGNMIHNNIERVALRIYQAILLALENEPPAIRDTIVGTTRHQPIGSDALQYIVSAESDFNRYAFVIFSVHAHEPSIQAWVGDRYQTGSDTMKRRNTITVMFHIERFELGHYTALIPTSEDVMARPTLDEISAHAGRLGINVNVNNFF
jgi:hypothetical protein